MSPTKAPAGATPPEIASMFGSILAIAQDIVDTTDDDDARGIAEDIVEDARHARSRLRNGGPIERIKR